MSTELATTPPRRSRLGQSLSDMAVNSDLVLQHCKDCHTVQYPPREVCRHCLSDKLNWESTDNRGELLVCNELHNSMEPGFKAHLPVIISSVKLDCGPVILCFSAAPCEAGKRVRVVTQKDDNGLVVFEAIPDN